MTDLLFAEHLCAGYGGPEILHDVSFRIDHGELCALLGANGSGKSTLIRAVCGLLPFRGKCFLEGKELSQLSQRTRAQKISYLSQRSSLSIPLSVMDVVLMGYNPVLGIFQTAGKAKRHRAMEELRRVGMEHLAERDILSLSEGQRQLVMLARTFVRGAPLLVLDEPDSALDFQNRHKVMELLQAQAHEEGRGVLLCSHDANFAMQYADRLLLMKDGKLCSDISMQACGCEELQQALSKLYGPITLAEHRGNYFMMKG